MTSIPNDTTSRLTPGIIHFDVSQGCTADILNGALLGLGVSVAPILEAFNAVGLSHISPVARSEFYKNCPGVSLDFVLESGQSLGLAQSVPTQSRLQSNSRRFVARWDRPQPTSTLATAQAQSAHADSRELRTAPPAEDSKAAPIEQAPQSLSIEAIKDWIKNAKLSPIVTALVLKAWSILDEAGPRSHTDSTCLPFVTAQRWFCDILAFAVLIQELNPLEISAGRLPMAQDLSVIKESCEHSFDEPGWLLAVSAGLPVYEYDWPAPYSHVVGVALLKAVASHFGPRGESRLMATGHGISRSFATPKLRARALWCEPVEISTRALEGPSATPKTLPSVQIKALLAQDTDVQDLIRRLAALGASPIKAAPVQDMGLYPKTEIEVTVSHANADKIIEALLATGGASHVSTHLIEQHALRSRTVSVAFGQGQKAKSCRVIEWLWGNRILRAEPLANDLASLVQTTGYVQEVVRGDVLMAWRRFRGQEDG